MFRTRPWLVSLSAIGIALGAACGPQIVDTGGDDTGATGRGERPTQAGAMYSACAGVDECTPLEFCVFPSREGGYCSAACAAPDDPSSCAPAPGDGAELSCLDIGLPDGRQVCALDCSGGACPSGMQCEAIETPAGARRDICF